MKNRLYLVCGVLLVAALGPLWWSPWLPREPPEPGYDGHPLSYWLAAAPSNPNNLAYPYATPWAEQVMRDPSAVPFLKRALRSGRWTAGRPYSKWLWPKLPPAIQSRLPSPRSTSEIRVRAAMLLREMDCPAERIIPALARALREDRDAFVKGEAAFGLGALGAGRKDVAAVLTVALRDEYVSVRIHATNALLRLDPEAAARAGVRKPSP
jgi:hypothetical protein